MSDFADGACMRALARAYDSCQEKMTGEERAAIRDALELRARRFFEKHINQLDARVFNAHVWQHVLHEAFEAALALHGECPKADGWIAYTYELWIARVPLLGGDDGAWANGINYFATNFKTQTEAPTIFERLTGADFFSHPWHRNARWSCRLHSPEPMRLEGKSLLGGHDLADVRVDLLASQPLQQTIGTGFDPPAVNWRGKKSDGKVTQYPDQWHFNAATDAAARGARFLAIVQVRPRAAEPVWHTPETKAEEIRLGPWRIRAILDFGLPPSLGIHSADGEIALAADGGFLDEGHGRIAVPPGRSALRETGLRLECADELPAAARAALPSPE